MAPWTNKTGLAKATAILATVLVWSLGLCGINFFGVIFFVPLGGPGGQPTPWPAYIFGPAAYLEVAAIIGSVIGLIIVGFVWVWRELRGERSPDMQRLFDRDDRDKEN